MTNSDLLVHLLEEAGVRWVFGIPSGPVLPLIESLRKSSVRFVLTASETSAGFMAATVGSLSGIPGVCVSTVGPGATNLTTGVGAAWLDRSPVIAITCNVATPWLERRVQMRIDHHGLFRPLTKATFSLRQGQVGETLARAIALARTEPPGPVHLDLPEDTAEESVDETANANLNRLIAKNALPDLSNELAEKVSVALRTARRPLLVTGLTFTRSKSGKQLLRFVECQNLPFVTTLHAKGFLPESHPNWAGVIGRARRSDVRAFTDKADLVLAIGYDPIEINYEEWVGKTPIMHVGTEAAEESKDLSFIWNRACDLDRAIEALTRLAGSSDARSVEEWQEHRGSLERALRPLGHGFALHDVLDILRRKLPLDGVLAYDVGAHTHQIATQWRTDHRHTCLATNGWSSMGYGMPAAFAAKLISPDRTVVAIVGDGGFQMTAGELAMARRLNLAVPTIVLNDGWLGLMKVKQEHKHYPLSGVYLGDPPESPAHYFGAPCRAAKSPEEFREALNWAFALNGPSVIEAFTDVGPYSATVFD
ncbi:MAG TPA: thiamine pyrophosphate-binding protein [Candidatus Binatia bacterium]|nr:thiamine pyrophosphate-binding protein [Candidatus Binatia bacterium]